MIIGIIMASGFSRRMGKEKLILKIGGVPIIERVIRAIMESKINQIVMIYRDYEIKKIGERYGISMIYSKEAQKGQSESIRIGISASDPSTEGFAFFVGDQPFLSSKIINELVEIFKGDQSKIIVPLYDGKRGNPVIFPYNYRDKLLKLKGDEGGKKVIDERNDNVIFVNIDEAHKGMDIDTWEEFKKVKLQYN